MRIGIEGQRLFRKKKHGMDMVALELIKELQQIDTKNEYFLYIKPDEDECIEETENFKIRLVNGSPYPVWEQISLPKAAKKDKVDILHCTSNTAPVFTDLKQIVTLHDIIYMEKSYLQILNGSGTYYQKFGNAYRRYIVPRMIKKVDKLITVSKFEKNRIDNFFNLNKDLVAAVYNGVSKHFKKLEDKDKLKELKEKYKLPDKFFFFLGNTDPKKNTPGTLKAFHDFIEKTGLDYYLVMLDFDEAELIKILKSTNSESIRNRIHLTGYIPNIELPGIVSMSEVFLYPSLRESFGIPMLEGMKCGVPVITSNTSSMPEVSGDAAYIIDPHKPEQITNAMIDLINDEKLRNDLIEKGYKRAELFSWKAMAENVLKLYQEIYNNK